MIEQVTVKAGFVTCQCVIDTDLIGISRQGKPTKGSVIELNFLPNNAIESKPISDYANAVARALKSWANSGAIALDEIGVEIRGTTFQSKVLRSMRSIRFGSTRTYRDLAEMNNRPLAYRAVANVCANNRIPLIIPCHRVIKTDGSIGGYFYGSELKQQLLDFESH